MQTMNDDKAAASWFRGFSMGICTGEKGHNELSDEMIDERSEYLKKEKDRHSPRSSMEDQGTPRSSVFPVKYSIGILPPDIRKVDTKNTASRARKKLITEIPEKLQSIDGFAEAWGDWVTHRNELGKKLPTTTVEAQFKKLCKLPDPVGSIRQSIEFQYQGFFPLKVQYQVGGRTTTTRSKGGYRDQFDKMEEFGDWVREQQSNGRTP